MNGPKPGVDQKLIKVEPGTLIWSEPIAGGGRAVVKMYRHKAFYDPVRRWFIPYRVEREYRLLSHLCRHDVACPEPLWWSHDRDRTDGLHELLATREIAGVMPLAEVLRGTPQSAMPDLAPLFQLARRMHECGVSHGAFYPTNILATLPPGSPRAFYLIDLSHGSRFQKSIVGTRPAAYDLLDMLRAIARRQPITLCAQWIQGYGLDATETAAMLDRLRRHSIERPWRHLHRAETDLRAAWDRITCLIANQASAAAPRTPPHTPPR
jgi:tRNA A-37 threonylcarbamoyl transferase component Bud32